jgi:hypothetical protein
MYNSSGRPPASFEAVASGGLLTSVEDILHFESELWKVTEGTPGLKLGSWLRLPIEYASAWGIGITPENRGELRQLAFKRCMRDYDEDRDRPPQLHKDSLMDTSYKLSVYAKMCQHIATIVKEMIKSSDDGEKRIRIVDVAAKSAALCVAIRSAILNDSDTANASDRLEFTVVHPSGYRLGSTRAMMREAGIRPLLAGVNASAEEFLIETATEHAGSVDFIVSLPYFHRQPFPDYIKDIYTVLADNGAAVIGDFHTAFWSHPFNTYQLLERLGVDETKRGMFMERMGLHLNPPRENLITSIDAADMEKHIEQWLEIAGMLKSFDGLKSQRLFLLSGHDTIENRVRKLTDAGLKTSNDDIRRAFPRARLPDLPLQMKPGRNYSMVTAAVKCK